MWSVLTKQEKLTYEAKNFKNLFFFFANRALFTIHDLEIEFNQ